MAEPKTWRKHECMLRASIALTLKKIREDETLTQEKFAHILGISVAALQNYEYGLRTIPPEIAYEIQLKYGVYVLDLALLSALPINTRVELISLSLGTKRRTFTGRCLEFRKQIVSSYKDFVSETHSPLKRKVVACHDNAFMSATMLFTFSYLKIQWQMSEGIYQGDMNFSLLLSFGLLVLTFPLEVVHMFKFWRWKQRSI